MIAWKTNQIKNYLKDGPEFVASLVYQKIIIASPIVSLRLIHRLRLTVLVVVHVVIVVVVLMIGVITSIIIPSVCSVSSASVDKI